MRFFRNICLLICLLTIFIACASTPKTEDTTVAVTDSQLTVNEPAIEYEQAKSYRQTIQKYELHIYSAETYGTAEQSFKTGETAYQQNQYDTARTALSEAIAQYKVIIANAFPLYFETKEKEVAAIRASAEEIKAQVALKNEYRKAVTAAEESLKEKQAGNYEKGAELLIQAHSAFETVYTKTKEKKTRAEQALEELRANIEQVEEYQQQQQEAAGESEKS